MITHFHNLRLQFQSRSCEFFNQAPNCIACVSTVPIVMLFTSPRLTSPTQQRTSTRFFPHLFRHSTRVHEGEGRATVPCTSCCLLLHLPRRGDGMPPTHVRDAKPLGVQASSPTCVVQNAPSCLHTRTTTFTKGRCLSTQTKREKKLSIDLRRIASSVARRFRAALRAIFVELRCSLHRRDTTWW